MAKYKSRLRPHYKKSKTWQAIFGKSQKRRSKGSGKRMSGSYRSYTRRRFYRRSKEYDYTLNVQEVTNSVYSWELQQLIPCQHGTSAPGGTENNVQGCRQYLRSIDLDVTFSGAMATSATDWSTVRVMIIGGMHTAATPPSTGRYGWPDPKYYRMLYDKVITLNPALVYGTDPIVANQGPQIRLLKRRISLGRWGTRNESSALVTYGHTWLQMVSDSAAGPHPSVRGMFKLWYNDPDTNR